MGSPYTASETGLEHATEMDEIRKLETKFREGLKDPSGSQGATLLPKTRYKSS